MEFLTLSLTLWPYSFSFIIKTVNSKTLFITSMKVIFKYELIFKTCEGNRLTSYLLNLLAQFVKMNI